MLIHRPDGTRSPRPHFDFLQPNGLLILPRLVLPLVKLVEVLSIIDDAAYGRIGRRRNLYQVQALSFSGFQRIEGSHDAKLPPLFINYPDFLGANPFVYSSESVGDKSSLPAQNRLQKTSSCVQTLRPPGQTLSISLPFCGPGVDKLASPSDKLGQRAGSGVARIPAADGHSAVFRLAITHHQHKRNLLQLGVANPRI